MNTRQIQNNFVFAILTKYVNQPTNSRHALKKSVESMDLSRILLAVKSI